MSYPASPPSSSSTFPFLDLVTRTVTCHATFAELLARPSIPTLRADRQAWARRTHRDAVLSLRRAMREQGKEMSPAWGEYKGEEARS